jgi:hypothetical protein
MKVFLIKSQKNKVNEGLITMKSCMINGDMSSDSATEQYPTVTVCNDCYEADAKREENAVIISSGKFDALYGDTCYFCDKPYEDE